jgi:hypothetical protein
VRVGDYHNVTARVGIQIHHDEISGGAVYDQIFFILSGPLLFAKDTVSFFVGSRPGGVTVPPGTPAQELKSPPPADCCSPSLFTKSFSSLLGLK